MNISDQGDMKPILHKASFDLLQSLSILNGRSCDTYHLATRIHQILGLLNGRLNIHGISRGHRLNDKRLIATHKNRADSNLPRSKDPDWTLVQHESALSIGLA
jgi:hypothetical protein